MRLRQESIDLVACWCERQRVGSLLRHDSSHGSHCHGVEYVDHAGVSDRHIEMVTFAVIEDDIRSAAQFVFAKYLARQRIERDQRALVASAEEALRGGI